MSRARDLANYGDGIDTSSITSGTFADARIASSNVRQHEGSIDALASNPTVTLGTNATFPAGHVLQMLHFESTETNSVTETYVNYFENSITLKSASSDVFVTAMFNCSLSSASGFGTKIYRNNKKSLSPTDHLPFLGTCNI